MQETIDVISRVIMDIGICAVIGFILAFIGLMIKSNKLFAISLGFIIGCNRASGILPSNSTLLSHGCLARI